jgi:hypothetical protein
MKLKHSRTLVAAILAGSAFSALAQDANVPMDADVYAPSADACPDGTIPSVPSYRFEDGGLVQDGWLCESLYKGRE